MSTEEELTAEDIAVVDAMTKSIVESDRRRFDAVMAEIEKDERECRAQLKQILIRRAAVERSGHL